MLIPCTSGLHHLALSGESDSTPCSVALHQNLGVWGGPETPGVWLKEQDCVSLHGIGHCGSGWDRTNGRGQINRWEWDNLRQYIKFAQYRPPLVHFRFSCDFPLFVAPLVQCRASTVVTPSCPHRFPESEGMSQSFRVLFKMVSSRDFQNHLGKWASVIGHSLCIGAGPESLTDIYHLVSLSHILYFPYRWLTFAWSKLLCWWSDPELQVAWPFVCSVLFRSWLLHFLINFHQWSWQYWERPGEFPGFQTLSPMTPFCGGSTPTP